MKAQRLWSLMLLGLFLFTNPVLTVMERLLPTSNPPSLWLYLYGAWALVIFLTFRVLR